MRAHDLRRSAPLCLTVFGAGADVAYGNMAAAVSFAGNSNRIVSKIDLSGFREARIAGRVRTVGVTGALIYPAYALTVADNTNPTAAEFSDLCSPRASIAINALGTFASSWQPIVAAAQTDVFFAVLGVNGDGVADPAIGVLNVFFR